jgi:hypothetical protein
MKPLRTVPFAGAIFMIVAMAARSVSAQTVSDALTFLLTNRSIPTGDFVQDQRAATAARDDISSFLRLELATLPISSSAGGFTYRLNPTLGSVERVSDNFGPFFIERSLTLGARRASFGLAVQTSTFGSIDGRSLTDGTLVSTAAKFHDQTQPFDVETLTLRIRASSVTLVGDYGVTDGLDVGFAVPFVTLSLSGQRIDTYRGQVLQQASASSSASGPGDVAIRAKYNFIHDGARGLAVGFEARLPTGNQQDLLGAGKAAAKPLLIGSFDQGPVAGHANLSYSVGGLSNEFDYGGAVTIAATGRLTAIGELSGRHLEKLGALTAITAPNTSLAGVDTVRLASTQAGANTLVAVAGVKWNVASTWLMKLSVVRPLTSAGLTARWIPSVAFDYSFAR